MDKDTRGSQTRAREHNRAASAVHHLIYSGHKITESLGNVTVRGGKRWKEQEWSAIVNSLSMYSITENIYCSQLSSVAILLQPEPVSHPIIQGNNCVFSPSVLSSFGLPLPPTCLVLTVSEARSYFVSTIQQPATGPLS
jgi:hypothetical protein